MALVAGLAVLNLLVVPEASACERHDTGVSEAMPGMDHAGMSMHHSRGRDVGDAPANRAIAGGLSGVSESADCHGMPCSGNCALMAGCTAHSFIAASTTIAATTAGAMTCTSAAAYWQGRDSAPDHPPPRA